VHQICELCDATGVALRPDCVGRILLGGQFTRIDGVSRITAARLETLQPSAIVSCKVHGAAGAFDLPLVGGIEGRSAGPDQSRRIVITFPSRVTLSGASVTPGAAKKQAVLKGMSGDGTNEVILHLVSVSDAQVMTITLSGVSSGSISNDATFFFAVLLGDTNGNGSVNASDVGQTKAASDAPLNSANFVTQYASLRSVRPDRRPGE